MECTGGTDQFCVEELGSSTKLVLSGGGVAGGGGMSGIETLGQKKSHTQGKRGMNMYDVFR